MVMPKPMMVEATAIYCRCMGLMPMVLPTKKLVAERAICEAKNMTN